MCNLYSITTNQAAISSLFRVVNRYVGNLAPMPGVFPDYRAPIVCNGANGRELATARWGMPSSQQALLQATKKRAEKLQAKGKTVDFKELLRMEPDSGTTNIRNVKSKHWTRWLGPDPRVGGIFLPTVVAISPFGLGSACASSRVDRSWPTTREPSRRTRTPYRYDRNEACQNQSRSARYISSSGLSRSLRCHGPLPRPKGRQGATSAPAGIARHQAKIRKAAGQRH
ncbi:hypothetical protein [Bradyrhizobium brasilense]|uniref:hypothetical protein n=1 Tax=Bradyrhizobium brasilense TaxID=1419277 RepID=UPI001E6388E2|nr:hypothetical protein [Bradyrhizobium brasilense]